MIKLQQNRYLWVHFAGLAFVPLLLDICLAGLASAGPALPFRGQFWAIALLGIAPGLAMQWFKPFYVFSLPPSALKPSVLSEDQRRCLRIFKSWQIKALAIAVAALLLWILVQLYTLSPLLSPMLTPRAGLISAAIAFFVAATFMQISVSAARALLIGPDALKRVPACEERTIAQDFLIAGIRVNQLLPDSYESSKPKADSPAKTVDRQHQQPTAAVILAGSADKAASDSDADDKDAVSKDGNKGKADVEKTVGTEETISEEETVSAEKTVSEEETVGAEIVVHEEIPAEEATLAEEEILAETVEDVPVAGESMTDEST